MKDYENILKLSENIESFLIRNEPENACMIKNVIKKAISNSNLWLDQFGDITSRLNTHMHVLEKISNQYNVNKYFETPEFVKIVIDDAGVSKIGEHINFKGKKWEIINRIIGNSFSVIFCIKSEDGEIFSHEFYD